MPNTLSLIRGETVLGRIEVNPDAADFPWFSGVFHATPEFERVRHLFDRELQLLRANSTDDPEAWEEWEEVHAELHDPGVRLCSPDSGYIAEEILIHINGTEAWWRGEEHQA
jgi:hypothetical protein